MKYSWTIENTNQILHLPYDNIMFYGNGHNAEINAYKLLILNDLKNSKVYNFAECSGYLYPYDRENNLVHRVLVLYDNSNSGANWRDCFFLDKIRSELIQKTIKTTNYNYWVPYSAIFRSYNEDSTYEIRLLTYHWGLFANSNIYYNYCLIYCPKDTPIDYMPFSHDYANLERQNYYNDSYAQIDNRDFSANDAAYFNYSNYPDLDENIFISYTIQEFRCVNQTISTKYKFIFGTQPYFYFPEGNGYISKYTSNYPFFDKSYDDIPSRINIYSYRRNSFVYCRKGDLINVITSDYDEQVLVWITTDKNGNLTPNIQGSLSGDSKLEIEFNFDENKIYIYTSDLNCYYECSITDSITELFANKIFSKIVIDETDTNHEKYPSELPLIWNTYAGILYGNNVDALTKNLTCSYNMIYDAEKDQYFPQLIADYTALSD